MTNKLRDYLEQLVDEYSNDNHGEPKRYLYETMGVVVSCDDPLENNRMQIFCPALNDDPKKLDELPWTIYSSPFMGTINNNAFTRGTGDNPTTEGSVAYGFQMLPEIGAHVLVSCIDGDIRRRVFKGCLPEHQDVNTWGSGRYVHSNNKVDGPLSSTGNPIQPLYAFYSKKFGDKTSPEWKTRGAEYQTFSLKELPYKNSDSQIDSNLSDIQNSEQDEWVKAILGEHGYDWTGFKNIGSYLINRVYGMSTPGHHAILMDDRHFNSRMSFRTTTGHTILLDDTNERIYVSTNSGDAWFEMDSNGHFDFYGKRISFHGEEDVNISSKRVRLKGEQVSIYAGSEVGQTGFAPEDSPKNGEIRIQSQTDMHHIVGNDYRQLVKNNKFVEVVSNFNILSDVINQVSTNDTNMKFDNLYQKNSLGSFEITGGSLNLHHDVNISATSQIIQLESSDGEMEMSGTGTNVKGSILNFSDTSYSQLSFSSVTDRINTLSSSHSLPPMANEGTVSVSPVEPVDPTIDNTVSAALLAPWTNRVPEHEPWARVMKIDESVQQNSPTTNINYNVDWVDQYNDQGEEGRKDIGKVYGDEITERGRLWRR